MKLSEIIYNIKNLRAGGLQSDDEQISDRQYAHIINYRRALLVKQEITSHKALSPEDVQDLGKVDLIQADEHECCEIEACVLRTKLKVPATLDLKIMKHGLTYVGLYGNKAFQESSYQRIVYDQYAKYTSKMPKWYFKGGYIYIVNAPTTMLDHINIQGLFEDPDEAEKFRTCDCPGNEETCRTDLDFEYPIAAHHVGTIVQMIGQFEFKLSAMIPEDTTNDGLDTN